MTTQGPKKLDLKDRFLFELLIGYSCNSNCRFCSVDSAKRNINSSTQDLLKTIYQAKKEGFKYLGIGGGEPTIRDDLKTLISYAKQLKFEIVRIETNGILLSYPNYCKELAEAGLDFVKISVHGHKPEIHDSLTKFPGSFNLIMKAIDNLQKLKLRVEINTVINKINYKYYPQFINFFAQKGIGSFIIIYPTYIGQMAKNWREVGVSMKEMAPYLKKALDLADKLEIDKALIFNIPPCCLPGYEKKMVEFSPFRTKVEGPNATVESVDFDRKKIKKKIRKCHQCKYFNNCEGIFLDYLKIFGTKEFKPIR